WLPPHRSRGSSEPASPRSRTSLWLTRSRPTRTSPANPSRAAAPTDTEETMRILVANVNTTQSMTDSIAAQARAAAAPGTEIIGITPRFGADSCEGNFESYLAAIAVMDAVVNYPEPF